MNGLLAKYLGVVPSDFALATEFNVFEWCRNKFLYEKGLINVDPGEPPVMTLRGERVTPEMINENISTAKRLWKELVQAE